MKKGIVMYADDPDIRLSIEKSSNEWRIKMDIETMRGEIIEHKAAIQILKIAVADLEARVAKMEMPPRVVNQEIPIPHFSDEDVGQGPS